MNSTKLTWRLTALCGPLTAALLSACTLPEPSVDDDPTRYPPPRPTPAPAAARVAQLGYDHAAGFAVCTPPNCPSVTRKTMAAQMPLDRPAAALPPPQATVRDAAVAPAERPASPVRSDPSSPPVSAPPALPASAAALAPAANALTAPRSQPPDAPTAPTRKLTLLFDSNSAELNDAHRGQIQGALGELRRAERLVISGRTDDQGSERLNQALAVSRALSIRRELLRLVPDLPARIEIDAKGRCCYVSSNKDEDGRSRNRRVELLYALPSARS